MASLVGLFVGTIAAVVVGEILSLIALFPPLSHWLNLDGEFSGLILIGMPMFAGGCGALAGLVLGLMYRRACCHLVSVVVGSLPAVMYSVGSYTSRESLVTINAIGGIMISATMVAVVFTHFVLVSIDRRRLTLTFSTNTQSVVRTGRVATVIASVLALVSLSYDAWLYWILSSSERLGHELPLIGAFGMGILAGASNVYVWAAHPNRKRVAMIAGFASFAGCVAVLAFWYLRLIQ
ncbi:hypothetical protein SH528x_003625 [Novipirellula sp. SH528]|uniref:hypothetical protein n=1 Tax=Novipirellula sp. SH528 TaxID=3454466 RepID=UPI003F9FC3EF